VEAFVIQTMSEFEYGGDSRSRYITPRFLEHLKSARRQMCCARCRQSISEYLLMEVRGSRGYHPSCARILDGIQQRTAPAAPSVIGRIVGVAVPFNRYCYVTPRGGDARTELFDQRAFDDSIRGGGQQLTIDHCGAVSGRLELFPEPQGLLFRHRVHDTPLGRQTIERITRGECLGCSIGFRAATDGETVDRYGVVVTRATLTEVALCFTGKPAWHSTCAQLES
jgi:HK97 family phage prohead protease